MVAKKYKLSAPITATDIRFYAPKDYDPNDAYEVNNKAVKLLQPDGSKVVNGWKAGSPIQFILNADKTIAYVDVAPASEGTSTVSVEPLVNVYSKTPSEMKNLTNLVTNESYEQTTGWTNSGNCSYSTEQYKFGTHSLKYTAGNTTSMSEQVMPKPIVGHKYYGRIYIKSIGTANAADDRFEWFITDASDGHMVFATKKGNYPDWTMLSSVQSLTAVRSGTWKIRNFYVNMNGATVYVDGLMIIDLTADFGAGNEPTKEWCDANIPFFGGTQTVAIGGSPNINALVSDGIYMYAGGSNGILYKIDMGSGEAVDSLKVGDAVNDMTISDDKKLIGVATASFTKIIDTQKFREVNAPFLNAIKAPFNSISIRNIPTGSDYLIGCTNSANGNNRAKVFVGRPPDLSGTMSEDGSLTNAEFDGQISGNLRKIRVFPISALDACLYGAFQTSNTIACVQESKSEGGIPVWQFTKHTGFPQALELDSIGNVYSGAGDGIVYKLNGETGAEIWKYTYGSVVRAIFVDNGGYVYVTGQSGEVHKLTPEGKLIWKSNIYSGINRAIFVDNGGYVYSGGDSQVVNKARTPAVLYSQDGKPSEIMQAYKTNNNYYIIP